MWEGVEARIAENEHEQTVPLRNSILAVLRNSVLMPGPGATKKMVALSFGNDERLVWQIEGSAQHFYFHESWQPRLEAAGTPTKPFFYQTGLKDGGRHSGLSRDWSFGTENCVQVKLGTAEEFRTLIDLISSDGGGLQLDPAAVRRWISRLRLFFPAFDRFDLPDLDFDAAERTYKLKTAHDLRLALQNADGDQAVAAAILAAASGSNLLNWRTYLPLTQGGEADRARLDPALAELARAAMGPPYGHPAALDSFAAAWREAAPTNSNDAARQIGEFLFLHLCPNEGSYIRKSVRQELWKEAVGTPFPVHVSLADTYADELRFMRAIRRAFEEQGLAPRDMIDVQSALWVVYSYEEEHDQEASADLAREAVEAAMDAYDQYCERGSHGELFGAFGDPRDYWVRSTRDRPKRVYPTKPIVGFIRGKTELNGGWGQKADAAARLHNSGFIIVDEENAPVSPPDRYDHLIRDADRIRLCALNYYFEPARERGASQVSIRASDLARDMGLLNAFPGVCSALGGDKLQQLARVPAPTYTEPNPSSTTQFTYQLVTTDGRKSTTSGASVRMSFTTNLILYGPPGTGKTYKTAWEAVRLCLGEQAVPLQSDGKRDELMVEYRRLVSEGRIEFVTFHQSMSYEEFVEGLRPETSKPKAEDIPAESSASGGFRLEPHDGIFKRMSERARLDTGDTASGSRLDRSRRVVRLGLTGSSWREAFDRALRTKTIEWPHGGEIDWSTSEYENWEAIKARRQQDDPSVKGNHLSVYGTWLARAGAETGEYVLLTVGKNKVVALGLLAGDYEYVPDTETAPARHLRRVDWLWSDPEGVDRAGLLGSDFTSFHPIYPLNTAEMDWDAFDAIVFGADAMSPTDKARSHVLIIDEINRANISKVFGELITLLEPDKRLSAKNEVRVQLPYSKKAFGVPANLHIIGTMNTADRSIALLDTALRRRFTFRELMLEPAILSANVGGVNLQRLLATINERIEYLFDREHQIGHAYFTECATKDDVEDVMRHKVIPLLAEYFFEDWSKVAAVLGDTGQGRARFLEARRLVAPAGVGEEDQAEEKLRWRVKDEFEFSEFAS